MILSLPWPVFARRRARAVLAVPIVLAMLAGCGGEQGGETGGGNRSIATGGTGGV